MTPVKATRVGVGFKQIHDMVVAQGDASFLTIYPPQTRELVSFLFINRFWTRLKADFSKNTKLVRNDVVHKLNLIYLSPAHKISIKKTVKMQNGAVIPSQHVVL